MAKKSDDYSDDELAEVARHEAKMALLKKTKEDNAIYDEIDAATNLSDSTKRKCKAALRKVAKNA